MANEQIISKGFYTASQINNFISVNNYILMKQDDKICLALRLTNDTEYNFYYVSLSVIQINAEGKMIGKTFVEYKNINFISGSMYVPESAIVVDPKCVDFKIQFHEATSGFYRYVVRKKRVIVYYDRKMACAAVDTTPFVGNSQTLTEEKIGSKKKYPAVVAFFLIVFILAAAVYHLLGNYIDFDGHNNKDEADMDITIVYPSGNEGFNNGVEYEEIQ